MAAAKEVLSEISSDNNQNNVGKSEDEATKRCNKASAVKVCVNCFGQFQKSCSKRMPHLLHLEGDRVVCCKSSKPDGDEANFNTFTSDPNKLISNLEQMKVENSILKRLLAEVEDKNAILKEHVQLYKEKVGRLENNLHQQKQHQEKQVLLTSYKNMNKTTTVKQKKIDNQ